MDNKIHFTTEQFITQLQNELLLKNKLDLSTNATIAIAQTYANTIKAFLAKTKAIATPKPPKKKQSKQSNSATIASLALTGIGNISVVHVPERQYYDIDAGKTKTTEAKRIAKLTINSRVASLL